MSGEDELFGSYGVLADTGRAVQCHVCGRWFRALGGHICRAHGLDPTEYRERYGLARTTALICGDLAEASSERGRERFHTDERVREALTSPSAEAARKREFVFRPRRAETLRRVRAAAAARAEAFWAQRLEQTGWESWTDAVAWARESGQGPAGVARRLGVSQTAVTRRAAAVGVELPPWRSPAMTRILAAAREHIRARQGTPGRRGALDGTTGDLARWLTARRYEVAQGRRAAIDDELDLLDPQWSQPRRTADPAHDDERGVEGSP